MMRCVNYGHYARVIGAQFTIFIVGAFKDLVKGGTWKFITRTDSDRIVKSVLGATLVDATFNFFKASVNGATCMNKRTFLRLPQLYLYFEINGH